MWLNFSAFLDAKGCLNHVLPLCRGHGKSPCFSGLSFLWLSSPDYRVLKMVSVDGVKSLV
jgi:hypothetical protein